MLNTMLPFTNNTFTMLTFRMYDVPVYDVTVLPLFLPLYVLYKLLLPDKGEKINALWKKYIFWYKNIVKIGYKKLFRTYRIWSL